MRLRLTIGVYRLTGRLRVILIVLRFIRLLTIDRLIVGRLTIGLLTVNGLAISRLVIRLLIGLNGLAGRLAIGLSYRTGLRLGTLGRRVTLALTRRLSMIDRLARLTPLRLRLTIGIYRSAGRLRVTLIILRFIRLLAIDRLIVGRLTIGLLTVNGLAISRLIRLSRLLIGLSGLAGGLTIGLSYRTGLTGSLALRLPDLSSRLLSRLAAIIAIGWLNGPVMRAGAGLILTAGTDRSAGRLLAGSGRTPLHISGRLAGDRTSLLCRSYYRLGRGILNLIIEI